ncbi:MAG: efflux RND transporter permease subunit, partial [Saprospiraceae bacterium]|nr:efflux RND transporter permease subunit [Saprospiraceae bacterium]
MKISEFSVKNYQFTLIMFVMAMLVGLTALLNMPRSEDPNIESPFYAVVAVYPGAGPQEMEELVVDPLENALSELEDVKTIIADISDGLASIRVDFKYSVDVNEKYQEVVRTVNAMRGELPQELYALETRRFRPSDVNILQVALVSETASYKEMETQANRLEEALEKVKNLKNVESWGYPDQQVRVSLRLEQIAQQGIPINNVLGAIQSENVNIPGGNVWLNSRKFNVKTSGSYEDVEEIRNTIVSGRNLRRILIKPETAEKYPHLFAIGDLIEECPTLVSTITTTIDDRGEVLDSASPKLAKIRGELRVMYGRIQEKLQRILNSSLNQYLQEPLVTMRNGRYVIPLKADAKGRIKGIVHDQSGSGATLWIEPIGTVELNNEFRSLELQEEQEIQRILAELSAKIGQQADSIKRVVERLAELDLIFARARYASEIRAYEPEFVEWRKIEQAKPPKHANELDKWVAPPPNLHPGSTIWIKAARHPLLNPETVVPTDLTLDDETFVVLITGPNTGGKTVSLKTMGLMVLMAQSGLHLPAQYARMTLFDHVFADIGDEQSIEQSLSTFSAHMSNIIRILKLIDDRSLVLLDELGSGTDPGEGAALAMSITNYLRDKGATTFIATHYPELKVYASQTSGATNASMLFDIETLSPTYEMTIGIPGRSNAFAIARRLGLDDTILDEAIKLVGTGSHKAEGILDAIYQLRDKITAEEAATRLALREAEQERERLHQRLEQIEGERRHILQEARDQAKADLEAVQNELRQMRRQMRDAASLNALKKVTQQVEELETAQNRPLETAVSPITPAKPRKKGGKGLQVGDIVL